MQITIFSNNYYQKNTLILSMFRYEITSHPSTSTKHLQKTPFLTLSFQTISHAITQQ